MINAKDPEEFINLNLKWVSGGDSPPADVVDMCIDASETQAVYEALIPKRMDLHKISIFIVDGSVQPADFGGILNGLDVGIQILIVDIDGITIAKDFTAEHKITSNYHFIELAGSVAKPEIYPGDDLLAVRWAILGAGAPMRLKKGQRVRVLLDDDLSTMTRMSWAIQGIEN